MGISQRYAATVLPAASLGADGTYVMSSTSWLSHIVDPSQKASFLRQAHDGTEGTGAGPKGRLQKMDWHGAGASWGDTIRTPRSSSMTTR